MTNDPSNPYLSPPPAEEMPPAKRASVSRGLAWAVPLAAVGMALPYAIFLGAAFLRYNLSRDYPWIDLRDDLDRMPKQLLGPGVGCALLFGMAAFRNFTPPNRLGLVRAMMHIGLVGLACSLVVGVITEIVSPRRTYQSQMPVFWQWCFGLLLLAIWVGYPLWSTARAYRHSESAGPAEPTPPEFASDERRD